MSGFFAKYASTLSRSAQPPDTDSSRKNGSTTYGAGDAAPTSALLAISQRTLFTAHACEGLEGLGEREGSPSGSREDDLKAVDIIGEDGLCEKLVNVDPTH
jgi:hypothetical protein